MRIFALAVGYGGFVVAPSVRREGLVALRAHVSVPHLRGRALRGDNTRRALSVVNVLFGLFLALSDGQAFAGRYGADAFGGVAAPAYEDACPPVRAVRGDDPRAALFGYSGGGDVT